MMMRFIQGIQRIQKKEALLSPCLGSMKTQRLTQGLGVHQERRPSLCLSHMTQHVQNLRIKAYRALIYRALILRLYIYMKALDELFQGSSAADFQRLTALIL